MLEASISAKQEVEQGLTGTGFLAVANKLS